MEVKRQYAYFSAAIRDGAALKPQSFTGFLAYGATCAIGAGIDAMGLLEAVVAKVSPTSTACDLLCNLYSYLNLMGNCPDCRGEHPIFSLIWHLNDDHNWTREAIADWLYTEEEKLGFVTVVETEALNVPEAGRGDSVVTEAQAGVLTGRF